MAFQFHLPDIGEGVIEGEIVQWKVSEGDRVALDQPMVEIMTDKATVEIPSPRAGTVSKIHFAVGEICPVGDVLVEIDEEEAGQRAARVVAATEGEPRRGNGAQAAAAEPSAQRREGAPEFIDASGRRGRVKATPATRRLARELNVDIALVASTGKAGRVTSADVRRHARRGAPGGEAAPARPAFERDAPGSVRAPAPGATAPPAGQVERIPFRGVRRRIAEQMVRSRSTAAHFTYVEEIDVTELVSLRSRAAERARERGLKLTFLPFIMKAAVAGLKKWPQLNASLDEKTQEIVRKGYYHIGVAAQGPQGLVVSVVRDADQRSIFQLAAEIERLGRGVQEGTSTRDDLVGSTFTISSLGKLGGVLATPILNFPEAGILGVHKIEEKPAVRGGEIVIRSLMNLSISLDHRIVDGWDGAMFLHEVKALLEDPTLMFLEMV